MASVSAPTASQLVIDPYDKSALGDVEKALFESDLGMTPNNDGKVIRLNVPALTEERRKELGTRREHRATRSVGAPHAPLRAASLTRAPRATSLGCLGAAKTAKSLGEDGKVALRNIRKTALDKIKKMKKAIGEDVAKDSEDGVQKVVKKYEDEVASLVSAREKEIMTI